MNLLLVFDEDRIDSDRFHVTGARCRHVCEILRAEAGDRLSIGVLNGPKGFGRVVSIDEDELIVEVESLDLPLAPELTVDLVCAIPRPKILRKVLFVAGMYGVRSVRFVRANRTDKSYLQTPILQEHGYRSFLLEGLSQGEWTRLPEISVHPLFRPFVEDELPYIPDFLTSNKLLADLATEPKLTDLVQEGSSNGSYLAVGPEGGWVDFERGLLEEAGFQRFSLGQTNLRVEYAVAVALGQLELARNHR